MFNIDDYVIYGSTGVCQIIDICTKEFAGEQREYYCLKPVYADNSTIFAPKSKSGHLMKNVLTKDEISSLISRVTAEPVDWISDDRRRKEKFQEIMKSGNRLELMKIVRTVNQRREELEKDGKKIHAADENLSRAAAKLISEEFATVLKITPDEADGYIAEQVSNQ